MNSNVLVIIPARGGSKGIPGKNLVKIYGKTLIEYAAQCVKEARNPYLDAVLSSDDEKILNHGKEIGLNVSKRPKKLAEDQSNVVDTVLFTLNEWENKWKKKYDIIILLQPTSPIRTGKDLDKIIDMFGNPDINSVISVVPLNEMHPARMYKINNDKLESFLKEFETLRRQEIPPAYYRNGCFYAIRKNILLKEKTLMPENKTPYIMEAKWLCNIDEPMDLEIAKVKIKLWKAEKSK